MNLIIQQTQYETLNYKEITLEDKKFIGTIARIDFDKIEFGATHTFIFIKNRTIHIAMIALHNTDLIDNKIEKWTSTKELIRIYSDYRINILNKGE